MQRSHQVVLGHVSWRLAYGCAVYFPAKGRLLIFEATILKSRQWNLKYGTVMLCSLNSDAVFP